MRLSELENDLGATKKSMRDMIDTREREARDFTPVEETTFDALEAKALDLSAKIARERKIEAENKERALNSVSKETPEAKAAKSFSLIRAISAQMPGKKLDGLEAEMHQEAEKELHDRQVNTGLEGVGMPSWLVNIKGSNVLGQKRDLTSGGAATGAEWVETVEIGHQFALEIAPKAFSLGVEVLTGLTGNVYITQTGEASAVWEGENTSADETTPATSKPVNLSPQRIAAFTDLSKTLMVQTSGVAEQRARLQLQRALNRKLDYTIFQGTGVDPIPTGVTALGSGLNTNAAVGTPDHQYFLDAWASIVSDNADLDMMSIITTPSIVAFLRGAYLDAGSGRFLMENGTIAGMSATYSNNIPANTILMGVWNQFVVGQWGGIDLVANPYTKAKENLIELIINANFDMGCYHNESFHVGTNVSIA